MELTIGLKFDIAIINPLYHLSTSFFLWACPAEKAGRALRSNLFWQKKPKKDFHFNPSRESQLFFLYTFLFLISTVAKIPSANPKNTLNIIAEI